MDTDSPNIEQSTPPLAVLIAATATAAAGVIHLVMTPSHLDEWPAEGWAFMASGWAQLTLAYLLLRHRLRWVPHAVIILNALLFYLWAWSRTEGLPLGPHEGHAAAVDPIDALAATAELLAIGAALWFLGSESKPATESPPQRHRATAMVPLVAVVLTTAVLAAPSTRNHAHEAHGDHSDTTAVAAATDHPDDGHSHDHDAVEESATSADDASASTNDAATTDDDEHDHEHEEPSETAEEAEDDLGWSLISNGEPHHDGHDAEPWGPMDPTTAGRIATQLAPTAELMTLFPTVADAEAAGLRRSGRFNPGLGVHYGGPAGFVIADSIDPSVLMTPMLIYRDTSPDAPLVGFMFNATSPGAPPEGFAGTSDLWHLHEDLCVRIQPDGAIKVLKPDDGGPGLAANCTEMEGMFIDQTGSMVHVWNVPGWENPLGLFHEVHPGMTCADGTYHQIGPDEDGNPESTCLDAL